MTVFSVWAGGVSSTSATVVGVSDGQLVRLAVDTDPGFGSPAIFGPGSNAAGASKIVAEGLTPGTGYHYALHVDGQLDTSITGRFATPAPEGSPTTIRLGAAACSGSAGCNYPYPDQATSTKVSNSPVFDTLAGAGLDFFIHMGDLHYQNLTANDPALYRQAYADVLAAPRQAGLYRSLPVAYVYDDHDFAGNDSDSTYPGRETVGQVYRERVPSYSLAGSGGVYHSFVRGRVLFVVLDCRYFRDPNDTEQTPNKTMLGPAQKAWLRGVLSTSDAKLLVLVSSVEWMGASDDTWAGFSHERDELVTLFGEYGWLDRMCVLNGNYHGICMDSGGNNHAGGFPVYVFASLDSNVGGGGGNDRYDLGTTSPGQDRYGILDIADSGEFITVSATAYIGPDQFRSHTFNVAASPAGVGAYQLSLSYDEELSRVRARVSAVVPYRDLVDRFDRSVPKGWGSAESGQMWQVDAGPVLTPSPGFESGDDGWSGVRGLITPSTAHARSGSRSLRLVPNDGAADARARSEMVPVSAGDPLLVTTWTYATTAVRGSFSVFWYDSSQAYAGSKGYGATPATVGVWEQRTDYFTVPAGVAYARLDAAILPTSGQTLSPADVVYFDDCTLRALPAIADYSVTGSAGRVALPLPGGERHYTWAGDFTDVEFTAAVTLHAPVAGGNVGAGFVARYTDEAHLYWIALLYLTDATVQLRLFKRDGGGFVEVGSDIYGGTPVTPGVPTRARVRVAGAGLSVRVWPDGAAEPDAWQVVATDTSLTSGAVGTLTNLYATNTNELPVLVDYNELRTFTPDPVTVDLDRSVATPPRWVPVRGGQDVPVLVSASIDDYEFPPGVPVTYRAQVYTPGGALSQTLTGVITVPLDRSWLKNLDRPWLNLPVTVAGYTAISRPGRVSTFAVVGSADPVAVTDVRSSARYSMQVYTAGPAETDALLAALAPGGPVFVQHPPGQTSGCGRVGACDPESMYAVVGDVDEERPAPWAAGRVFTLPLTKVAAPASGRVGGSISWAGLVARYDTWADVAADNPTWADVLDLVGRPGDLPS